MQTTLVDIEFEKFKDKAIAISFNTTEAHKHMKR